MNKPCFQILFRAMIFLLAMTVSVASSWAVNAAAEQPHSAGQKPISFRGAWFDVNYPGNFSARSSLKSSTAEGYDSAEFTSPDKAVSFYVFAPQWGGNASDIALDPELEQLVDEQIHQGRDQKVHWFTIRARDGSYRRSYQETIARQGTVKTIVGIKYSNEEARQRYQKAYQQFRSSLKLYAD